MKAKSKPARTHTAAPRNAGYFNTPHDIYHPAHRCQHCGCRLEQHAGKTNPVAPVAACPRTTTWATLATFPSMDLDDAAFDAATRIWWNAAGTTFKAK
jgi:hypothetical protein